MESQTELMELQQVDNEWQGSGDNWKDELILLKQALADKEEVLSRSIRRWRMGTLCRMEAVRAEIPEGQAGRVQPKNRNSERVSPQTAARGAGETLQEGLQTCREVQGTAVGAGEEI